MSLNISKVFIEQQNLYPTASVVRKNLLLLKKYPLEFDRTCLHILCEKGSTYFPKEYLYPGQKVLPGVPFSWEKMTGEYLFPSK